MHIIGIKTVNTLDRNRDVVYGEQTEEECLNFMGLNDFSKTRSTQTWTGTQTSQPDDLVLLKGKKYPLLLLYTRTGATSSRRKTPAADITDARRDLSG